MCKDFTMAGTDPSSIMDVGWSPDVLTLTDIATRYDDTNLPKYLMVHKDYNDDVCELHLQQGDLLEIYGFEKLPCVCGEYEANNKEMRSVSIPISYDGTVKKLNKCEYSFPTVKDLVRHFPKFVKVTYNARPEERLLGVNEIIELVKADEHLVHVKRNGSNMSLPLSWRGDFEEVLFQDVKEYNLEELINNNLCPLWIKLTEMKKIREGFTKFTHFSGEVKINYVIDETILLCRIVKDEEPDNVEGYADVMCLPVECICSAGNSPTFKIPTGILRHSPRQFSAKPEWDLTKLNTIVNTVNFVTRHRASLQPRKLSITDVLGNPNSIASSSMAKQGGNTSETRNCTDHFNTSESPVPPPRRKKSAGTIEGMSFQGTLLRTADSSEFQDPDGMARKKASSLTSLSRVQGCNLDQCNILKDLGDKHFDTENGATDNDRVGNTSLETQKSDQPETPVAAVVSQSSIPDTPPPPPPIFIYPDESPTNNPTKPAIPARPAKSTLSPKSKSPKPYAADPSIMAQSRPLASPKLPTRESHPPEPVKEGPPRTPKPPRPLPPQPEETDPRRSPKVPPKPPVKPMSPIARDASKSTNPRNNHETQRSQGHLQMSPHLMSTMQSYSTRSLSPPRLSRSPAPRDTSPRSMSPHSSRSFTSEDHSPRSTPPSQSPRSLSPSSRPSTPDMTAVTKRPNRPKPIISRSPTPKRVDLNKVMVPVPEMAQEKPRYLDMTGQSGSPKTSFNASTHPKPPPSPPKDEILKGHQAQLDRKTWQLEGSVNPPHQDDNYVIVNDADYEVLDHGSHYFSFTSPVRSLTSSPRKVPPALPPRPKHRLSTTDSASSGYNSDTSECAINNISDITNIPTNLRLLGVNGLADALALLKLNKLADICKENLIDGKMFVELNEEDLKGEPFNLSGFYLTKAVMFKDKGWLPNLK